MGGLRTNHKEGGELELLWDRQDCLSHRGGRMQEHTRPRAHPAVESPRRSPIPRLD